MAKLDKQNRLVVPQKLLKISDTNFDSEVRLYMRGVELFFDNPSPANFRKRCLGKVLIDNNGRFHLPKLVREIFDCKIGDNFTFYLYDGKITFKRIFFIPENR